MNTINDSSPRASTTPIFPGSPRDSTALDSPLDPQFNAAGVGLAPDTIVSAAPNFTNPLDLLSKKVELEEKNINRSWNRIKNTGLVLTTALGAKILKVKQRALAFYPKLKPYFPQAIKGFIWAHMLGNFAKFLENNARLREKHSFARRADSLGQTAFFADSLTRSYAFLAPLTGKAIPQAFSKVFTPLCAVLGGAQVLAAARRLQICSQIEKQMRPQVPANPGARENFLKRFINNQEKLAQSWTKNLGDQQALFNWMCAEEASTNALIKHHLKCQRFEAVCSGLTGSSFVAAIGSSFAFPAATLPLFLAGWAFTFAKRLSSKLYEAPPLPFPVSRKASQEFISAGEDERVEDDEASSVNNEASSDEASFEEEVKRFRNLPFTQRLKRGLSGKGWKKKIPIKP